MSILQKDRGDAGLATAATEEAMPLSLSHNLENGNGHSHNGNGIVAHRLVSPDEYLRVENAARDKSEYIRGRIYPMAGAKPEHNTVLSNISRAFYRQLDEDAYPIFQSDQRVQINEGRVPIDYVYPDLCVVQGEPRFNGDHLLNPTLIVEVLSKSTEVYDQTTKFEEYKLIDSLREIIFAAQKMPYIARHVRTKNGDWRKITEITQMNAQVTVLDDDTAGGCVLLLKKVYANMRVDLLDGDEDTEMEAQP